MTWMFFRFVERYITPSVKDISLINKKQNRTKTKKQNALKKSAHNLSTEVRYAISNANIGNPDKCIIFYDFETILGT